jgi:hypothetical protein
MVFNEQWSQEMIDRQIRDLRYRADLMMTAVHARDYICKRGGGIATMQAAEILMDGIKNLLDPSSTGLEWWTVRHRLSNQEIQSGSWLHTIKTSWITAGEAELKRNGKQR